MSSSVPKSVQPHVRNNFLAGLFKQKQNLIVLTKSFQVYITAVVHFYRPNNNVNTLNTKQWRKSKSNAIALLTTASQVVGIKIFIYKIS